MTETMCRIISLPAIAILASGCIHHRYQPERAQPARFPGLEAEVRETVFDASFTGSFYEQQVEVDVEAVPGTQLARVAVVPLHEPGCGLGAGARVVRVDGFAAGPNQEIGGERRLEVVLPIGALSSLDRPQALELELAGTAPVRCVRIPLPPPRAWREQDSFSWGMRLESAHMDTPLIRASAWAWGMGLELGRWVGPVKVAVVPGFLLGSCKDQGCQASAELEDNTEPVTASAKLEAAAYPLLADPVSFGLVARFELAHVDVPEGRAMSEASWFGPSVAARVSFTEPVREHPYPRSPKMGSFELELSVGRVEVSTDSGSAKATRYASALLLSVPM
ncbi:MAG: hypothetical protein ACOC1F_09010 [Myxococcota bacterium]